MTEQNHAKLNAGKLFSVDGMVAVITGGGSGLGAIMARALALNGASKVFIIARREKSLQETVSSIPDGASKIIPITGDVTSKSSLQAAYDTIAAQTTHIDILVANSGVIGPTVQTKTKDKQDLGLDELRANLLAPELEDLSTVFNTNITGVQYTVATFLPLLDAANKRRPQPPSVSNFTPRPQIITTGSIGGYNRVPLANLTYGPSKSAVMHLTKQLATLLVPYDVRANCIAPGMYLSEMTQGTFESSGTLDRHNVEGTFPKDYVPATRTGDEEDMAGAILYLCSRAGAYVNGNILVTDGGRLSVLPATY